MQRRAFMQSVLAIPLTGLIMPVWSGEPDEDVAPMPFGFGGGKKMLYDCRQRSQAVYLNDQVLSVSKELASSAIQAKCGPARC